VRKTVNNDRFNLISNQARVVISAEVAKTPLSRDIKEAIKIN
jgi:hypothetical protein